MAYSSLEDCIIDLEKNNMLVRIAEEVDPYLEMAAIHLRIYNKKGPAILFEKVKGSRFRAASNLFGTLERSEFIFRNTISTVKEMIQLKGNPMQALKHPLKYAKTGFSALHALPLRNPLSKPVLFEEIEISDLPLIHHWQMDGGAFITLPQVYTEDIEKPGIMNANLGMYRIQLSGNDYLMNQEVGLHYQLHRGIGVHQTKAHQAGKPMKVSVFVGGPPSHSVAAVMPLPEGMSEMMFAGLLGARRFRYCYRDGYCISTDADFVITGEVHPNELKPEGPFGDHLGYYSLQHLFPLMRIHKVYARKNAIWAFTVVGRPPQEDTSFGELIHAMTGQAIQQEIPGLKAVHAVDAAGVHPLLLAIGTERYTPFNPTQSPAELLTIANHMLGTGQLSLAKYLFITADESKQLDIHHIAEYLGYVLARIQWQRDVHFYTQTTMDTLDYSGGSLNMGSKVVFAAYGEVTRKLGNSIPKSLLEIKNSVQAEICLPGVLAISFTKFETYSLANIEIEQFAISLNSHLQSLQEIALIIICDDASFVAESLNNFLWVTFTRSNPATDIYGVDAFTKDKHWGCNGPLIIDARIKPHHAPPLVKNAEVEKRIDQFFEKGAVLEKWK
jgi:4-hydroxy-3-polyprenylbenzoate decarboxylase